MLTDETFFPGQPGRSGSGPRRASPCRSCAKILPSHTAHILEAAAHGADAILLIAAILTEREMRDFREAAARYRMAALVEVHNRRELDVAIAAGSDIIGVNNRDLTTFEVTLETSLRLAEHMPAGALRVSESGIHDAARYRPLRAAGYTAFLVGEHLMKSGDPAAALRRTGGGMILKICGITNQEDAAAAIDGGATAIGFNFYPRSPRYIAPERAAAIATAAGVRRVGVFVNEAPRARRRDRAPGGARRGPTARRRDAPPIIPQRMAVWKAVRVAAGLRFRAIPTTARAEALLLDGPAGGTVRRRGQSLRLEPGRAAPRAASSWPAAWTPPTWRAPSRWRIPGAWTPARASKARRARRTTRK